MTVRAPAIIEIGYNRGFGFIEWSWFTVGLEIEHLRNTSLLSPHSAANLLRGLIANGDITECEGLALFADSAAEQGGTLGGFISSFGELTPTTTIGTVVPGISAGGQNLAVNGTSAAGGGFKGLFQDGGDQSHHFAAFFQIGFLYGETLGGALGSVGYEVGQAALVAFANLVNTVVGAEVFKTHGQSGDLNTAGILLGYVAAQLGSQVASGALSPSQVGGKIRSTVCGK